MVLEQQSHKLGIQRISTSDIRKGIFKVTFQAMGCPCEIQFRCEDQDQASGFKENAIAWVRNFEATYSRFKEDSLLSRINRMAGMDWVDQLRWMPIPYGLNAGRLALFVETGDAHPVNLRCIHQELASHKLKHPLVIRGPKSCVFYERTSGLFADSEVILELQQFDRP